MKTVFARLASFSPQQVQAAIRALLLSFASAYLYKHGFEPSQVESVAAAFAGLVAVSWEHYLHAPTPLDGQKASPAEKIGLLAVLLFAGLWVWPGCAVSRPYARSETVSTNGTTTIRVMKSTTFALWPASQHLSKEILVNGEKQALNESALVQKTDSTNVTEAPKAIDSIIGKIKP